MGATEGKYGVKVLLVEPLGHREGHHSFESRRVSYALVNVGVEITLVTFMGVQGDWADREKRVGHFALFRPRSPLLTYYEYFNRSPLARSLFRFLETFLTLALAVWINRKRHYDVVHIFDSEPAFFFSLVIAFFLKGRNMSFTVYNPPPPPENWRENLNEFFRSRKWEILPHTLGYELGESRLGTFVRRFVYRRALAENNILFLCHTRELIQSYQAYMSGIIRDRFVCIPLGVERPGQEVSRENARQHLRLPSDRNIFLTFGNNHPGKDFEVIFRAFAELPSDFVILQAGKLGTGPETGDPQRLARKYKCSQNTVVEDKFVSEEEKAFYFRASDVAILSYKKDFIQSASIINDAAKFSTPVIASDVGQLGEFVRTYNLGITFTPEDPQSLREAISSFLQFSDEERQAIKENFARLRADYSWEENARQHLEVYQRLGNEAQK